jgi:hypothetical protein
VVRAESVDDRFTQITPSHSPGAGEYIHGQGYGKILVRVMLFGAVPQQGIHYVPEGTDILFALLYAGGYGEMTKLNGITIRRRGVQELLEIDLEDLIEEGKTIPKLADGDVVNVPYNWKKDYQEFQFFTTLLTSITSLVALVAVLRK